MKTVVFGFVVFAGLRFLETTLMAHSGQNHSHEVAAHVGNHSASTFQVDVSTFCFLLLATAFIVLLPFINPWMRRQGIRFILLVPSLAALIVPLFHTGCEDRGVAHLVGQPPQSKNNALEIKTLYGHFQKDGVTARADDQYIYIESTAFPSHPLMIGITAWQQQVPLPQPYSGKNSWRIPLQPVVAAKPVSARNALFRGAIALAVNGVPIFNALNNRGEDAFLAGELDEYGGHCGRGDDYHYHVAPTHLEKIVGRGKPIAFALDGFPIHGFTDADGKVPGDLDEFNGRFEKDGNYRYYSTRKYPYINGGMRGIVTVRGDQIEPQPRDSPARPAQRPLRGAKVTDFSRDDGKKSYTLKYDLMGNSHSVKYTIQADGKCVFVYTDFNGRESSETFRRRDGQADPPSKKN